MKKIDIIITYVCGRRIMNSTGKHIKYKCIPSVDSGELKILYVNNPRGSSSHSVGQFIGNKRFCTGVHENSPFQIKIAAKQWFCLKFTRTDKSKLHELPPGGSPINSPAKSPLKINVMNIGFYLGNNLRIHNLFAFPVLAGILCNWQGTKEIFPEDHGLIRVMVYPAKQQDHEDTSVPYYRTDTFEVIQSHIGQNRIAFGSNIFEVYALLKKV